MTQNFVFQPMARVKFSKVGVYVGLRVPYLFVFSVMGRTGMMRMIQLVRRVIRPMI